MKIAHVRQLVKILRDFGVHRYKTADVEIEFGAQEPRLPQTLSDALNQKMTTHGRAGVAVAILDHREIPRQLAADDIPGGDDFAPDMTAEQKAKAELDDIEKTLLHSAD